MPATPMHIELLVIGFGVSIWFGFFLGGLFGDQLQADHPFFPGLFWKQSAQPGGYALIAGVHHIRDSDRRYPFHASIVYHVPL